MALDPTPRESPSARFELRAVPAEGPTPSLADDVRAGFDKRPRELPSKHFYDDRGSALFDRICETPEYYPTRTEAAILAQDADAIVASTRPQHIVELGAGTARKTEILLAACERAGIEPVYWPFDVCEGVLRDTGERLLARFPPLRVNALVGDYTAGLAHLPRPQGRCLYVFLGGTIGNFEPGPARTLLAGIAHHMDAGDAFLLGVDRVKARATLEAAYDDAAGITAEFNRNVLNVVNRELRADFDPQAFNHRAVFNEEASRMEMYLEARRAHSVTVRELGRAYDFGAGESLFTEISRKFTRAGLHEELAGAGLALRHEWLDPERYFSLSLSTGPD